MLNIPDEIKALFQRDGVHKNFHVHFPNGDTTDLNNENIVQESVSFTESLCSQQYFKFGLAEASQIEFTAVGIPNILGSTIECAIEIDCTSLGADWADANPVDPSLEWLEPQTCMVDSKLYYRVPYGRFIVDSCPRDHSVMAQRKVVAYSAESGAAVKKQFQQGQFPTGKLSIDPICWVLGNSLLESEMTRLTGTTSNPYPYGDVDGPYTSDGKKYIRSFSGIITRSFAIIANPNMVYAIRPKFDEHEFDQYYQAFVNKAVSEMPNASFLYVNNSYISGQPPVQYNVYTKQFKDNATAESLLRRWFVPCYQVVLNYRDNTKPYDVNIMFRRYSMPVFIVPNETFIIDLRDIDSIPFVNNLPIPSDFVLDSIRIIVSLPERWNKTAWWYWTNNNSDESESVDGWSSVAPFGEASYVERTGESVVYYKTIDTNQNPQIKQIVINNTLKIQKGDLLGTYYTYSNAISVLGVLVGIMELVGRFWKYNRNGSSGSFEISKNQQPAPVLRTQWEEFWWDENEVESIGVVGVKFSEDSGEQGVKQFLIGNGMSIYMMEDNVVLANSTMTQTEIQDALETYFEPNASVINFTPVDLTMKGLPYLEAGDKIELTADDGEIVESYILEQTIKGIQHLQADITSTNGELLEVIEDE